MAENDFDKFLNDLGKTAAEAEDAAAEAAPEAVSTVVDPFAHLVGHSGPIQEKSPFDAFLDEVAADAPTDGPEEEPQYESHEWKTIREAIYEDDYYVWRCSTCHRQVNVQRTETLAQACQKVNLNPNCGMQVVNDIQES
jgi:hypothetical protein